MRVGMPTDYHRSLPDQKLAGVKLASYFYTLKCKLHFNNLLFLYKNEYFFNKTLGV